MKCKKCGKEIENGLMYCPECGESIQLVPDYNVLEEELLFRVVEDKNKAKDDRFATGVYKKVEHIENDAPQASSINSKTNNTKSNNTKAEPLVFTKKIKAIICAAVILIAIIGCFLILPYAGTHTYDSLMNSAVNAENNAKYAKALGLYEEAYALDNTSFEAIYGLGRMYYRVKDYNNAIKMLEQALEMDPDNEKIYTYLISSFDAIGDKESIYELASDTDNAKILELINAYILMPPSFNYDGGEYDEDIIIQLSSTGGYQIFYTLNGKNPTTSGKLYTKPIQLKEGKTVIKAVTQNEAGEFSEVVSNEYTISYPELSLPVVSPTDGIYDELVMISIEVPEGCVAYYTWDGTNPATNGIQYTEPFPIIEGSSVLSVVIVDEEGNVSPTYHGDYIYQP